MLSVRCTPDLSFAIQKKKIFGFIRLLLYVRLVFGLVLCVRKYVIPGSRGPSLLPLR